MNTPNSREVFRLINPRRPQTGPWLIVIVIVDVVCWMLWLLNTNTLAWLLPVAIWLTLFPFVVYGLQLVQAQKDYARYAEWLGDTGFPIHGWEHLGKKDHFPAPYYWVELKVTIKLEPGTPLETIKQVEEKLALFTTSAARAFYRADHVQSGSSKDLRSNWTAEGLTTTGSANGEVMGYLYYFLQRNLRQVHNKTNAVEAVQLEFGKTIFHVRPVQIRGAGNT